MTRDECEAQMRAAVEEFAAKLGVAGPWLVTCAYGRAGADGEQVLSKGDGAAVETMVYRRTAHVAFDERLPLSLYRHEAAHEVLHVLFSPLERAIDALKEPAKTVLDDHLHACIGILAAALSDGVRSGRDTCLGDAPPWEPPKGAAS